MNAKLLVGAACVAVLVPFFTACSQGMATSPSGSAPVSAAVALSGGAISQTSTPDAASGVVHSVTGSGGVVFPEGTFRNSVAAFSNAAGDVWGDISVPLNLRPVGLGITTFSGKVTCLSVNGNSAWIGFTVLHSTNGDIAPISQTAMALVRDLGGPGKDVTDGEFVPPDLPCTDQPTAPFVETVVSNGNYTVR